ncbi:MAG: type I-U CRISPR-associated RAMP protein Csb1/Cas7u [Gammaproteobacteria bacterium]|nr:type I-U CRISPR-associated RAMP protein Csb1/Cas7u [Gammaproteobacteria bacterium]MDE0252132.1 type I-U CRISPR-associated RAMP protein Csb1/Cas7u [Gammaproteobacteria bacterium]MDE0402759.1 type I-U CRISPR-associated RAMP protein Csb1/Cas7u [Gammaproteobacteria bacterium]
MSNLSFEKLYDAIAGEAVAIRSRTELQPAGGRGDKVFPPSYSVDGSATHKYAVEERLCSNGEKSISVLLDSVASQANRAELALLEGWNSRELKFPVPYVDFSVDQGITDYEKLTVLEVPHRIADAIFRDSLLDGTLFRLSDIGRAITNATPRDATGLFRYSPTALLFGMWDSTGPKGGLGSKFQRAYVSEIIGLDVQFGAKVSSRLDPLQIEKVASDDRVYKSIDDNEVWTEDSNKAAKDNKGHFIYASRGAASGEAGQPSKINHGNIPPSIDKQAGGVTISHALQVTVISFAALRKLFFKGYTTEAQVSMRTSIAALGIAALAYQQVMDFDLRSRCLLIPTHSPKIQMLKRDGSASEEFAINQDSAAYILNQASENVASHGVGWETNDIRLTPAPKLLELIKRSQKLSVT